MASQALATAEEASPASAPVPAHQPPLPDREVPPPSASGQSSPHGGDDLFQEYLPRSKLTVSPRPLSSVEVPFPENVQGTVDLKVVVSVFIDETGYVRRVRMDNSGIAPEFAQSILNTFLAARFKPGEVNAVPVRSQVRLQVEFRTGASTR